MICEKKSKKAIQKAIEIVKMRGNGGIIGGSGRMVMEVIKFAMFERES